MQTSNTYPYSPITGNGLGVCYSSLKKVGPVFPQKGLGAAGITFYPNLSNGNLFLRDRMLRIPQSNFTLELGFVYNSQATDPKTAWRFSHKKFVNFPNGNNPGVLEEADGHLTQYIQSKADPSLYFAEDSLGGTKSIRFDSANNVWVLHDPETGLVELYSTDGLLRKKMDAKGRATLYEYDNNQLKITTPTGNHYTIVRNGNSVTIMDADNDQPLQEYSFDDQNRLLMSSTPDVYDITYTYVNNTALIYDITQSDNSYVQFDLQPQYLNKFILGKTTQNNPDQSATNTVNITYANSAHPNQAWIEDNIGVTALNFDQHNDLTQVSRQNGYDISAKNPDITQYAYTPDTHQLSTITSAGQGIEKREYDASNGNVLKRHTMPNQQMSDFIYTIKGDTVELLCKTDYLDPNNLQMVANTRYVYEEINDNISNTVSLFLRFKISPEGRVTEYRRLPNDPKRYIDTERTYLASQYQPQDQIIKLSDMLSWVSQQDASQVSLKKYGYDNFGNLSKITEFTVVDAQGNGIQNGSTGVKEVNRNLFGSVERTKVNTLTTPAITNQSYDDLQRLKRKVDALKNQTKYDYQDAQSQVMVTYANASTKTQGFNAQGFVLQSHATALTVDKESTQQRDNGYTRDGGGRVSITTLPDGSQTYSYYDRQNRLGFTVTALGIVTEYRYHAQNRYNTTIQYANPIEVSKLWSGTPKPGQTPDASVLVALLQNSKDPLHDRTSYTFLDKSGRRQYKVDAENYVTQYLYDNVNNRVGTIRYATKLTDAQITQLKSGADIGLVPDFTKDRCTRNFYDNDGLLIGKQDPAGYVTQFVRDGGGRITQRNLFYTQVPLNLNQSFSAIIGVLQGTKAGNTLYSYDARGQMVAKLNAEGYYTAYLYSPDGLRIAAKQYANKPTGNFPSVPVPDKDKDLLTTYGYDLLGRRTKTLAPFNRIDNVQFDVMGNIILNNSLDSAAPQSTDGDHLRQTATQYDGWSQAVNKANAYVGELLAEAGNEPVKIKNIWDTQSQRNKYDQTGLLLSTTDPLGNITYIYYDADRRPVLKINANLSIEESTLDSFGKEVVNRKYANFYDMSLGALTGGLLTNDFRQKITGLQSNLDHIIVYERDKRGNITKITDAEQNISQKTYNAFGQIDTELLPVNSANPTLQIQHGYDTRGNQNNLTKTDLTPGSTATPIAESWEFKNPLNIQTKHTNTLGGVEEQEHDLVGNVITKKSEGVIRNTYTHDFINRISTEADAYNNTTGHTYGADHSHTITLPSGKSTTVVNLNVFNQTVKTTDTLTNAVEKTHEPDGQVNVHTDQLKNKTQQDFDLNARKKTYTDALTVQTAFGYSPVGAVSKIANDAQSAKPQAVNYTPDAFSNPVGIVDPRQTKSKQVFTNNNNLQQLVTDVGGLELTKTYGRNAQGTQTSYAEGDTKNPNQYVENNLVDGFNRAYGKIVDPNGLAIQTTQILDAANNTISETDADSNVTRHYFTNLSQLRFTVTPEGGLKERFYDDNLRLKYERVYYKGVTVDATTTLAQLEQLAAQAASNQDALLYYFYDVDGNEAYRVNSLGAVAQSIFNTANPPKVIQTISYSTKIDPTKLNPNLTTAQLAALIQPNPAKDRNKYYIRDAKGQASRIVDGEGYVVAYKYNAVGKPIVITKYANKVSDPNQMPAPNSDNDRNIYSVYDNLNRKIFDVETFDLDNANGRVTKFVYDENNNPTQTIKFADKFAIPATYDLLVAGVNALVPDPAKDDIEAQGFDNANRLYLKTDGLGFMEHYELNSINLTKMRTDKMGNQWHAEYDGAKRQTLTTDPEVAIFDVTRAPNGALSLNASQQLAVQTKTDYYPGGKPKTITAGVNTPNPRVVTSTYNKNQQLKNVQTDNVPVDDLSKPASFDNLPVTAKSLLKRTVNNVRNQKVAECDERGQWTFTVYDSEGKEVYKILPTTAVHKQIRNAFGEIERTLIFNQGIDIDLTPYQETGIPLDVVDQAMANKLSDPLNRSIKSDRNRNGKLVKQTTEGDVLFAAVVDGKQVLDKMSPESNFGYNAFGELTYTGKLQSPGKLSEEFKWYNKSGKELAVCNTNGRVDLSGYSNPFHDKTGVIQWAGALKQKPDQTTTYRQLLSYYQANPNAPDRVHVIQYNIRGKKTGEGQDNIIVQQLMLDNPLLGPYLKDLPPQSVMTLYVLNALDNITGTLYANGAMACQYYDARQTKIAETGVPQTGIDGNKRISLTLYYKNAFKEEVGRLKYVNGAVNSNPTLLPPDPANPDPQHDQLTLRLVDPARGKPLEVQDGDSNLVGFTVNETAQVVRTFRRLTNKDHASKPQPELQMLETRFGFEAFKKPTSQTKLVNGVTQLKTLAQYNLSEENTAQGFINSSGQPEFFQFTDWDVTGHSWRHNRKGIPTVTVRNGCGHIGLELKSMTQDLRQIKYDDIPALVQNAKMADLMKTWIARDSANRETQRYLPGFTGDDPTQPKNIPLSMVVGKQFSDIGTVSLSWAHPAVTIIEPRMTIWPLSNPNAKTSQPVKKSLTRFGIDLSLLPSDVYGYEMEDHLIDDDPKILWQTTGVFQCDTGIIQGSTRLVVEVQNDSTLFLTGNTTNLTAVKLFKDGVQVGADITVPANHLIDLSAYQSGTYTVQPIVTGQDNLPQSLPFTIFTNTLSDKPLALELDSTFGMKFLYNNDPQPRAAGYHVELDWTVSDPRYNQLPIEIVAEYTLQDPDDKTKYRSVYYQTSTTRQTNLGTYRDEKGNTLTSNVFLPCFNPNDPGQGREKAIVMVSLHVSVKIDDQIKITICNSYNPTGFTGGIGHEIIREFQFKPTTTMYVTPVTEFAQPPAVQYFDTSSGIDSKWTLIDSVGVTSNGVVVDVTPLPPGNYPFKMAASFPELRKRHLEDERRRLIARFKGEAVDPEIDGIFPVTLGSMVFSSTPELTDPTPQVPMRATDHDNFDNISQLTDTYGYQRNMQRDARNKLMVTEDPEVEVMQPDGTKIKIKPVTKQGYDIRGNKVGVCDPNGHTKGWIVDEFGQIIKSILADGTVSEQKLFNALQQMIQFLDSTQEEYTLQYDNRNNVVLRKLPSGKVELFWFNELNSLGSYTDTAGKTVFYQRDINDNISAFISAMGNVTTFINDLLTNQPTEQKNSDNTFLKWLLDSFGYVHGETDLSGAQVSRTFNFLMQPTSVKSTGGNHGNALVYTKKTGRIPNQFGGGYSNQWGNYFLISTEPTSDQNMLMGYREDGTLISGVDLALTRTTTLGYDSEGRRTHFKAEREGNVIREIGSFYDPLGRMLITYGAQEVVMQDYDAVGNIPHRITTAYLQDGSPVVYESWNTFDENDYVKIYDGTMVNKLIQIQPGKGWSYTNANGLRQTQATIAIGGTTTTQTLTYNPDKLLNGATGTDGSVMVWGYDPANRPNNWTLTHPSDPHGESESQSSTWNDDGYLIAAQSSTTVWKKVIIEWAPFTNTASTTFGGLNAYGMPTTQNSTYTATGQDGSVTDNLQDSYVNRDQPEQAVVGGTRTDSNGTSPYNAATNYQGPNPGELTGQDQSQSLSAASYIEQDCLDGQFLKRMDFQGISVPFFPSNSVTRVIERSYLADIDGNLAGSINVTKDLNKPDEASVAGNFSMPSSRGVLVAPGKHKDETTDFTIGVKMVDPVSKSYPPMSVNTIQAKNGDTFESIAQILGSTEAANAIAAANAGLGDTLQNGNMIKIPQWIQEKYQVGTTEEFDLFITTVTQQLYPQLLTPQPDDDSSWLDEMLDVAIVIVSVAIGNIAGGGLALEMLAAASTAAMLDAAKQEIEIQAGMRDGFTWQEVVQLGVESAFAEFAYLNPADGPFEAMMQAGELDIEQQLVLMATTGSSFSIEEVIEQMGSAGVGYKLQQKLLPQGNHFDEAERALRQAEINAGTILSSDIIKSAITGEVSVQELESSMAQFVGTEVGQGVAQGVTEASQKTQQNQQPTTKRSEINNQLSDNLDDHSALKAVEDELKAIGQDIDDAVKDIENFFDPSVTQPNAQVATNTQSQQSQQRQSNAQAMAKYGIHSRPAVLNQADANGNYIGTNLGLPDNPAIDNFDPNSDGTLSGSGLSKQPSLSDGNNSGLGYAHDATFAGGTGAGIGENMNVVNDKWVGDNGKLYEFTHQPNQYTGPRNIKIANADFFWKVGVGVFFVDAGVSAVETKEELSQRDFSAASKTGLDVIMSGVAAYGGLEGVGISTAYFAMKEVIADPNLAAEVAVETLTGFNIPVPSSFFGTGEVAEPSIVNDLMVGVRGNDPVNPSIPRP